MRACEDECVYVCCITMFVLSGKNKDILVSKHYIIDTQKYLNRLYKIVYILTHTNMLCRC